MNFKIYGPFDIPIEEGQSKKTIDKEDILNFWKDVEGGEHGLSKACGCYVFGLKTDKGAKPWYVGKAEKQTFGEECFTPSKLNYYHSSLLHSTGSPVMFFIAKCSEKKGKFSRPTKAEYEDVRFVEKMFIELAFRKNEKLWNKQHTKNVKMLSVEGFYNSGDGRRKSVKEIRNLLGMP